MSTNEKRKFKQIVTSFYKKYGRHTLPWRKTADPYKIVISELMLQQTQVSRVLEKYKKFIKQFPTAQKLAQANQSDVLREWSGLGYNRRAKYLHQSAKEVVRGYKGVFPKTKDQILALSGIGPYTAGAIMVFAYNKPEILIETNIRTVYLHHFFPKRKSVSDKELSVLIKETVDMKNPKLWYWALMDYGSHLKKEGVVTHRNSKHYAKQSVFQGSRRLLRGYIIRTLTKGSASLGSIRKNQPKSKHDAESVLRDLLEEGLIIKKGPNYSL